MHYICTKVAKFFHKDSIVLYLRNCQTGQNKGRYGKKKLLFLLISMGDTGEKAMLSKVSVCKNWITKYNLWNFLNKFWFLINNVRCLCSTQHKTSVSLQYNTLVCRANGTNRRPSIRCCKYFLYNSISYRLFIFIFVIFLEK